MYFHVALRGPDADHEHLIYINDRGMAECSKAKGHKHPLTILAPTQEAPTPIAQVEPAENHTHYTQPLDPSLYPPEEFDPAKDAGETEADVIKRKVAQYENAWSHEEESIQRGQESVRFREGDQWPDEARKKLSDKDRACLTINQVAPMIETLSGIYRRNRTDLRAYPNENGDADIATVLTYAMKNVLTLNHFDAEDTEAFEDMVVAGRGLLELYPDFDADIEGQLKITHRPWDMAIFGPHLRKDLGDCEYFFYWSWQSKDRLTNLYPEFKDEISAMFGRLEQFGLGHTDLSDMDNPLTDSLFADPKTREIKLLECEEKVYYRLKVYVDPSTGGAASEYDIPKSLRNHLKSIGLLRLVEQRKHRIRRTILAGDIVLEDNYVNRPTPPLATGPSFPVFPYYSYKRGARFEGKVERTKDPQREINKRRSQIVDIVNTSINNGWLLPKGTFSNQQQKQKFLDQVSAPGFVVEIPETQNPPQKIDAGQVSPSIVQLEMNSLQSFRETSNVNVEMLGTGSQYQSGAAMAHRLQQGLMGNEYLFDNVSQAKKRLGLELLLWIQELYTPERIARLFFNQAKLEPIFMGDQQQVDPYDLQLHQQIVTRLKDADLTKYDVTIGETGQSPTAQLANFELMMELAGKGVPLPPALFIELAPIPNKERIMQMLGEASQQQAQAEDKKYETEIRKTMIAAQSKRQA